MSFIANLDKKSFAHQARDEVSGDLSFELRGKIAPFLEVSLAAGQGLVCDRSCVLHHDVAMVKKPWSGLAGNRWLVVNTDPGNSASIMLTTNEPGCAGSFNLDEYDGRLICMAENLMAHGRNVTASYYARFQNIGVSLVMLAGRGWVFLRSRGDVFQHHLTAGEKLCVRAKNVAAMTATVDFEPIAPSDPPGPPGQTPDGDDQPGFVTLTGPGHIWIQSMSLPAISQLPGNLARGSHQHVKQLQTGGLAFLNETGP